MRVRTLRQWVQFYSDEYNVTVTDPSGFGIRDRPDFWEQELTLEEFKKGLYDSEVRDPDNRI